MCGIFGISYGPQGPQAEQWSPEEFATLMFPAIVHRGRDAFGWMYHVPDGPIEYNKFPGVVSHKRNLDRVSIPDNVNWFVCHVRAATKGNPKNNNNNHPLISGNVIGVHNGTLDGDWRSILEEVGRENEDATVDSEAIFAAVSKWGVKDGLAKIRGTMVTVLAETSHPDVLHIARAYGRPLVYATTEAGSLIFASECCVIDACGLEDLKIVGKDADNIDTPYTEVSGQYRLFKVVQGQIVTRAQYRTPPPKRPLPSPPVRVPFEAGGTSGITDYFSREHTLDRRSLPAGRSSLDDPADARFRATHRSGTRKGSVDRWGGEYLGAGWYRTKDGKVLPVAEYIEYCVQREVDSRLDMEDERQQAIDAAMEAEERAQAIINGTGTTEQ